MSRNLLFILLGMSVIFGYFADKDISNARFEHGEIYLYFGEYDGFLFGWLWTTNKTHNIGIDLYSLDGDQRFIESGRSIQLNEWNPINLDTNKYNRNRIYVRDFYSVQLDVYFPHPPTLRWVYFCDKIGVENWMAYRCVYDR